MKELRTVAEFTIFIEPVPLIPSSVCLICWAATTDVVLVPSLRGPVAVKAVPPRPPIVILEPGSPA